MNASLRGIEDLAKAGEYEEALMLLDELAEDNPGEARIPALRAFVNAHHGNYEAAIADWTIAIRLCEKEIHYYYMRGINLFRISRYDKAIIDFSKVLELCDYHNSDYYREPAYFFRADTYLRLQEFDKARSDCRKISDKKRLWTDKLKSKADILAECNN